MYNACQKTAEKTVEECTKCKTSAEYFVNIKSSQNFQNTSQRKTSRLFNSSGYRLAKQVTTKITIDDESFQRQENVKQKLISQKGSYIAG